MLRKSKYLVCAAAVGFAGILGAFSLSQACDKPVPYNDGPASIEENPEPTSPAPALTKVRNDKSRKRTTSPASSNKTVLSNKTVPSNKAVLAKRAQALLTAKCVRCHGGNTQQSGLDLRSRQAILKGGDSGPALIPGQPDTSLLLQRVRDGEMPPRNAGKLSPQEITTLQQWIKAGAP